MEVLLSKNVKNLNMAIRAINHGLRQKIYNCVKENKRICVEEIMKQLNIGQSEASQHLAILRRAGFVSTDRRGKYVDYYVNQDAVEWLNSLADDWTESEKTAEEIRQRNLNSFPTSAQLASMTA